MRRLFTRLVSDLVRRAAGGEGDRALRLPEAGAAALPASRDAVDITGLFLCDRSACDGADVIGD
jgi:hypothetical protein